MLVEELNELKNRIRKAHPNRFEFATHIKKVEATDRARIAHVNHGGAPPNRREEGNVLFTVIWRRTYGKGPLR